MTHYAFTDRTRRALQVARDEAEALQHEYIGVEHILLGMLRDTDSAATTALAQLGVQGHDIRTMIDETVKRGMSAGPIGAERPYTSRAKNVVEFAMVAAREHGDSFVGTQHLLLGILREQMSIGAQALTQAGVTDEKVAGALDSGAVGEDGSSDG